MIINIQLEHLPNIVQTQTFGYCECQPIKILDRKKHIVSVKLCEVHKQFLEEKLRRELNLSVRPNVIIEKITKI